MNACQEPTHHKEAKYHERPAGRTLRSEVMEYNANAKDDAKNIKQWRAPGLYFNRWFIAFFLR